MEFDYNYIKLYVAKIATLFASTQNVLTKKHFYEIIISLMTTEYFIQVIVLCTKRGVYGNYKEAKKVIRAGSGRDGCCGRMSYYL